MTSFAIRPAGTDDVGFLRAMLVAAACWRPDPRPPPPPPDELLALPEIARYLDGFPRAGDHGLIADIDARPVGAVWWRRFTADDHGWGFVDAATPELSIALDAAHRGRGIGSALLAAGFVQARLDGHDRLSLSVELDNPARRLYLRAGFVEVAREDGGATMVATLVA